MAGKPKRDFYHHTQSMVPGRISHHVAASSLAASAALSCGPPQYGREFFASEDNLNLSSRRTRARLASTAGITDASIDSVALFGWPTNLILTAGK